MKRLWWQYGLVLAAAGAVYVGTCAPGAVWQDSGMIQWRVLGGDVVGRLGLALAHPLYYWIVMAGQGLLGSLGIGEAAWRINAVSAVLAAVGVATMFLLVRLWSGRAWPGAVAAITLGVAHTYWRHAAIPETYDLYVAFLLGEMCCLVQWSRSGDRGWAYLLAMLNGMAVAVHMLGTLALAVWVVVGVGMVWQRRLRWRDVGVCAGLWVVGALPYLWLIVGTMVQEGAVWEVLRSAAFGQGWAKAVLNSGVTLRLMAENAGFFGYNFATPTVVLAIAGFVWMWRGGKDHHEDTKVTKEDKKEELATDYTDTTDFVEAGRESQYMGKRCSEEGEDSLGAASSYAEASQDETADGSRQGEKKRREEEGQRVGGWEVRWGVVGLLVVFLGFAGRYTVPDRYAFFLPFYAVVAVLVGLGAAWVVERVRGRWRVAALAAVTVGALAPAGVYAVVPGVARRAGMPLGVRREVPYRDAYAYFLRPWRCGYMGAEWFAREALEEVGEGAVLWADNTTVYPLLYVQAVEGVRPDVTIASMVFGDREVLREDTIEELLAEREVWVVTPMKGYSPGWLVEGYEFEAKGVIWQVVGEKNSKH